MSKFYVIHIEKSLDVEIEAENFDEAANKAWEKWEKNPPAEELFLEDEYEDDEEE